MTDGCGRRGSWLPISLAASVVVTVLDAALLERRMGIFRGGFLVETHLNSMASRATFILISIATDLALLAPLIATVLFVSRRCGLGARCSRFLAVVAALSPVVAYDFVTYRLASFLGQAFDLSLLFQLVGSDVREFAAIGGGYLTAPATALVGVAAATAIVAHRLHRVHPAPETAPVTGGRARSGLFFGLLAFLVVMTVSRQRFEAIDGALGKKASGSLFGKLVTLATDVDWDGYGLLQSPKDTALFDSRVHPYALDLPGNGIDEDGVAGDLPGEASVYSEEPRVRRPWPSRPDVVLVLLESVRDDAVGAVIAGRPVTPTLDGLAATGIRSRQAYSHNGYTYQSRFHLFSGSLANLREGTLIDDFRDNGYQVAYVSGQDESFGGREFDIGADRSDFFYDARVEPSRRYTRFAVPGSLGLPLTVVEEQVQRFLQGADTRPIFLCVCFQDTHFPYHHDGIEALVSDVSLVKPGQISRGSAKAVVPERRDELRLMYLNTVANVDRAIGNVLREFVRKRGREPGVIVTSDHGESLFEDGFLGHGYMPNEAQTRVPFVVSGLGLAVEEPLGHADVRDLILRALSEDDGAGKPSLTSDPARAVFQYIGNLERPRSVSLKTMNERVTYDFMADQTLRTSTATVDARVPPRIARGTSSQTIVLIRRWEAMLLARLNLRSNPDPASPLSPR